MSYIEEIDELIESGHLNRAMQLCLQYEDDEKVKYRIANIFSMKQMYNDAEEICYKYPGNKKMQRLLVETLIKHGSIISAKYEEAKQLCKKYMDEDEFFKSKYVKVLIKAEEYDEAEKICKEEISNIKMLSQLIKIYMKQNKLAEAKELCEKNLEIEAIKSQYVTVLIGEGNTEEAKQFCPNNPIIQSQLISIYMSERNLDEAKKVAEANKTSTAIKGQLKIINSQIKKREHKNALKQKEERKDEERKNKEQVEEEKEIPYINIIKSRIYMDDLPREIIEEIKKSDLDDWQKMISIIAIYKKKRENGNAELTYKEAKKMFKSDPIKLKKLNSLNGYISSSKNKMFDLKMFDGIINWHVENKYCEEIQARKEREAREIEEDDEKNKKIVLENKKQKEEQKAELEEENVQQKEEIKKEQKVEETVKVNNVKVQNIPSLPTKSKKNKNKEKEKSKKDKNKETLTIIEVYGSEITKLKAKISVKANSSNINYIKEFNAIENIEEKSARDLRVKMQLVMYLRKYDLEKEAKEALPQEFEIYDLVNKMMMYKRADSRYDDSKIMQQILDKVAMIDGDNDYIYKLLDNNQR